MKNSIELNKNSNEMEDDEKRAKRRKQRRKFIDNEQRSRI